MILKAAVPQDVMTAASVEEEEDMDLSEEGGRDGEVGIARDDDDVGKDGADEELHPPGEDLNGDKCDDDSAPDAKAHIAFASSWEGARASEECSQRARLRL